MLLLDPKQLISFIVTRSSFLCVCVFVSREGHGGAERGGERGGEIGRCDFRPSVLVNKGECSHSGAWQCYTREIYEVLRITGRRTLQPSLTGTAKRLLVEYAIRILRSSASFSLAVRPNGTRVFLSQTTVR